MLKHLKFFVCSLLVVSMLGTNIAWAGYVPSTQAMETEQTQQQRAALETLIERKDVRASLEQRGVSAKEAKARLALLSPSQIDELKTQIDTLPAGEGAVGAVIGAAIFVFVVLLITDLVGATDAYDFDN